MPTLRPADAQREIAATIGRINNAWLEGRPQELAQAFDDEIVMVFPGFSGRVQGRAALIAGFEEFCDTARVRHFELSDEQIDVVRPVAVASFRFEMVYEREGQSYRSTGRDFWVFREDEGKWRAVWRTMLDVIEDAVAPIDDRVSSGERRSQVRPPFGAE